MCFLVLDGRNDFKFNQKSNGGLAGRGAAQFLVEMKENG
jgi:hypothetical protein